MGSVVQRKGARCVRRGGVGALEQSRPGLLPDKAHRNLDTQKSEVCAMQDAATVLSVIRKPGEQGLPLKHLHRQPYHPQRNFRPYARLSSNDAAMPPEDT